MICNNCWNYQPCPSGVYDGHVYSCKARISKEYKREVMDGERSVCIEFERID